jgi:hypothetical protein
MKVPVWAWLAWVLMFLVLESISIIDAAPNDSLTQTVLHHVPGLVIVAFLGWLSVHFVRRVLKGRSDGL